MKKVKRNKKRISRSQTIEGVINIHPKGFGFVCPFDKKKHPNDIFIPKQMKKNAVNGDTVSVKILPSKHPKKGPEGSVMKILKREKSELVATLFSITKEENYELFAPSLGTLKSALVLKNESKKYVVGDRLLLRVKEWGEEKEPVLCEVLEKIGSIEDASTDTLFAIKDF